MKSCVSCAYYRTSACPISKELSKHPEKCWCGRYKSAQAVLDVE